jgi:hypothetical protein
MRSTGAEKKALQALIRSVGTYIFTELWPDKWCHKDGLKGQ